MRKLEGIPASEGIAIRPAFICRPDLNLKRVKEVRLHAEELIAEKVGEINSHTDEGGT